MEGPVRHGDLLYGTAHPSFGTGNGTTNADKSQPTKRESNAFSVFRKRLRKAYRAATTFCRKRSSESSGEDRLASNGDRLRSVQDQDNNMLRSVQDHDKDTLYQRLVTNVGRQVPFEYYKWVLRTGLTVRKDQLYDNDTGEETPDVQQMQHTCSHSADSTGAKRFAARTHWNETEHDIPAVLCKNEASIEGRNQHTPNAPHPRGQGASNLIMKQDDTRSHTRERKLLDPKMSVFANYFAKNGEPSVNSVESGYFVEDLKNAVSRISEDLNQDASQKGHSLTPRQRTKQRQFIKSLTSFRFFNRYPPMQSVKKCPQEILAMMSASEFCYPRYANEETRRHSLRNCTDPQLCGYEYEELARVGWFFNRRALVTFCCGMEMPMTPNGHPLDVHIGLSPQCEFARSLLRPAAEATSQETSTTERQQEDLQEQASGVTELKFSTPVQATDDGYGSSGVSAEYYAFDTSGGIFQGGCQESAPGDHWVTDGENYLMSVPTQMSDASYIESLVTNRTPSASEQWQPFSRNQGESSAQQRQAGMMQNSGNSAGRLFMRGDAHNPFGNARLLRDLDSETGRRSPQFLPPIDQININGQHGDNYRPRYPQFGFPSVRVWTFEGWPRTHAQTPSMLADAGFFYAGKYTCSFLFTCT